MDKARLIADIPKQMKIKLKQDAVEQERTLTDLLNEIFEKHYERIKVLKMVEAIDRKVGSCSGSIKSKEV